MNSSQQKLLALGTVQMLLYAYRGHRMEYLHVTKDKDTKNQIEGATCVCCQLPLPPVQSITRIF